MDSSTKRGLLPPVLAFACILAVESSVVGGEWLDGWLGRGSPPPTRWIHQRPAHPNGYQDGMVVHAGGAYAGQVRSLDGHGAAGGHHCRDGRCGDHCVARPDVFGFYGTRWRAWPGTSVVQASGTASSTPVSPPRSERPSERAESLDPQAPIEFGVEEPLDDADQLDSITLPGLGPARPAQPKPPRQPSKEPTDDDKPAPRSEPEPKPPTRRPKSSDDNLFDESSNRRRMQERLAVIRAEVRGTSQPPTRFPGADGAKPLSPETSQATAKQRVQPASAGLRYPQTVSPLGGSPRTPQPPKVKLPQNPLR